MNALPSQSRFIIGTEACERFSFYGMKSILMLYMTGHLLMSENWATSTLHIFVGMVYLLPVAGFLLGYFLTAGLPTEGWRYAAAIAAAALFFLPSVFYDRRAKREESLTYTILRLF